MNQILDSSWWYIVAAIIFILMSWLSHRAENIYRVIFAQETISLRDSFISILFFFFSFVVVGWYSQSKIPHAALISIAAAAGILRGVYRVDRLFLVIPDRLQLAGLIAGISFVTILALSGEPREPLITETLFALGMVGLLWLLSYVYLKIRGTIGFGLGDVKLLGWLALFTGKRMSDLILIAIALGITQLMLTAAKFSFQERKLTLPKGQDAFAFGPAIVVAFFIEALLHYA